MQYFKSKGLTQAQAAGIVGNLIVESGDYLNPAIPGGIAQWNQGRLTSMLNYEGGKPNFEKQVEFVWFELTQNPSYGLAALRSATTPAAAAVVFMNDYEHPNPSLSHQDRRVTNAQRVAAGDYGSPA